MPPPLPSRSAAGRSLPTRDTAADPANFSANAQRISTRDVQRAVGRSEGVWFEFDSQALMGGKVDPEYDLDGKKTGRGLITIEYVSGAVWEFADRPMSDWYDLIESSSKGRFNYYEVRGPGPSRKGMGLWKPATEIKKAWRSSAEIAAIRYRREPRTRAQKRRTYTKGGRRQAFGAGGQRVPRPPAFA